MSKNTKTIGDGARHVQGPEEKSGHAHSGQKDEGGRGRGGWARQGGWIQLLASTVPADPASIRHPHETCTLYCVRGTICITALYDTILCGLCCRSVNSRYYRLRFTRCEM